MKHPNARRNVSPMYRIISATNISQFVYEFSDRFETLRIRLQQECLIQVNEISIHNALYIMLLYDKRSNDVA